MGKINNTVKAAAPDRSGEKISKAVITCGGYATRFLPITKAVPKEMLPIGNKPIIHYIMQELFDAGITEVLILAGRGREALLNYFDINYEIDDVLAKHNKKTQTNFFAGLNISYRRVQMPRGVADNIWHAKEFIGGEHFLVALCDEVFFNGNPSTELVTDFSRHGNPVMTACAVSHEQTKNYGILKLDNRNFVESIVEKPQQNPPSNLCAPGRYLLCPEIFSLIEEDMKINPAGKEVCMTAQLNKLCRAENLRAVVTAAKRFDTGTPQGLFDANNFIKNILYP